MNSFFFSLSVAEYLIEKNVSQDRKQSISAQKYCMASNIIQMAKSSHFAPQTALLERVRVEKSLLALGKEKLIRGWHKCDLANPRRERNTRRKLKAKISDNHGQ